jgi:alpha-ribazole phosphatase
LIVLVRHPPVSGAGRCYGRTDLPLADPADAARLAARLLPLGGTIWTSPLRRCRDVATALGPHHVDPRLQELDFGVWENRLWDDVPRAALDAWAADPWGFSPPGGESGAALVARVTAFHAALPPSGHVVITHGGPLKVLAALLHGRPVDLLAPAPPLGSVDIIR